MIVHLFKSTTAAQYCLTNDPTGANLPPGPGGSKWRYVKDVALEQGDRRLALDTDLALAELAVLGYFLVGGWYDRN